MACRLMPGMAYGLQDVLMLNQIHGAIPVRG